MARGINHSVYSRAYVWDSSRSSWADDRAEIGWKDMT